jgi:hypothetical protein
MLLLYINVILLLIELSCLHNKTLTIIIGGVLIDSN